MLIQGAKLEASDCPGQAFSIVGQAKIHFHMSDGHIFCRRYFIMGFNGKVLYYRSPERNCRNRNCTLKIRHYTEITMLYSDRTALIMYVYDFKALKYLNFK